MADRSETAIVILVLVAAALVLVAPVLGRMGHPTAAGAAMWGAAGAGVASFAVAAANTLRASRGGARGRNGAQR